MSENEVIRDIYYIRLNYDHLLTSLFLSWCNKVRIILLEFGNYAKTANFYEDIYFNLIRYHQSLGSQWIAPFCHCAMHSCGTEILRWYTQVCEANNWRTRQG